MAIRRPNPWMVTAKDVQFWLDERERTGEKTFVKIKKGKYRLCVAELVDAHFERSYSGHYTHIESLELTLDGVKKFKVGFREYEWDFMATEVFVFDKAAAPIPEVRDRIGRTVGIGDFIAVSATGSTLRFGTVKEITYQGTLIVDALDRQGTFRAPKVHPENYENVVIINDDLKPDLMLYKLSLKQ